MDKEKIKNWFKDKDNLILVGILVFATVIRLYYFFLTKNQPLWWDEADYMSIGKSWAGIYSWEFNPLRPILFSLTFFGLLKLGLGEFTMRVLVVLSSLVAIFFLFRLGELFFNKKVGLLSAFFLASFWSFSFYTYRLLVDVPLTCFWILTIYTFFYAYLKDKPWKYYFIPGILLGLSFLMKGSSVALVSIIALYILVTERKKAFTNLNNYVFYGTAFLTILPYIIWQKIKFGSFIAFFTLGRGAVTNIQHTFFESLRDQTVFAFRLLDPSSFNPNFFFFPFVLIFSLLGIALLVYSFLLYEKIPIKSSRQNIHFFILLWLLMGLLFFGWNNYGDYMEERYYFVFYPAIFMLASIGIYKIIEKINVRKIASLTILVILLSVSFYQHTSHANSLIVMKKDSFEQLKQAGLFIRENTLPGQNFTTNEEMAELVYYSEREVNFEGTIQNITHLEEILLRDHPKYLVFSNHYYLTTQKSEEHYQVLEYVFTNQSKFTPVRQFGPMIDQSGTLPLVTVFKINS